MIIEIPAAIDPHVHFRTPGAEHKENWISGAHAAIAGGITTVLDMPNTDPAAVTAARLREKREVIDGQLTAAGIPLRYGLYLGADRNHLNQITSDHGAVALKIFMGSSTGTLLMDGQDDLDRAFRLAAEADLLVAVHAEDESMISQGTSVEDHSRLRPPAAAARAVERAIELVAKYGTRLYICHTSCADELELIRQAKLKGMPVFAEATPHHLFLDTRAYSSLSTRAQMNPPLRAPEDREALWEALLDGTIDTVGTDHAPHLLGEKDLVYPHAPSGVPGVETMLPLLLTALPVDRVVELTSTNTRAIFRLEANDDIVGIDLETERPVEEGALQTRCGWSPFAGWNLTGWPVYTVCRGKRYEPYLQH